MKLPLVVLLVTVWCDQPAFLTAAETDTPPIEQKLFDDVAARMQEQLHSTAGLLDKIRQSHSPKERDGLVLEYHKSMKTTMAIDRLIHEIRESANDSEQDKGKMMKGKKMGGSMGCCMMGKKPSGKQSTDESAHGATASSSTDDEQENNKASPQDEHEGHH